MNLIHALLQQQNKIKVIVKLGDKIALSSADENKKQTVCCLVIVTVTIFIIA
jgi:hypothetical protein